MDARQNLTECVQGADRRSRNALSWSSAWRALQLAGVLFLVFLPPVQAGTARASIGVSVLVLAPASVIRTTALLSDLEISRADIRRGYIERRQATQLLVDKAARVGFSVNLTPTSAMFSQMTLDSAKGAKLIASGEADRIVGWNRRSGGELLLDFRFKLAPNAQPGSYAWPMQVTIFLDY